MLKQWERSAVTPHSRSLLRHLPFLTVSTNSRSFLQAVRRLKRVTRSETVVRIDLASSSYAN